MERRKEEWKEGWKEGRERVLGVTEPAATAPPENKLKTQIIGPHPRSTQS